MSQEISDLGPLDEAPAYMLYRIARLLRSNLQNFLKSTGLNITREQYFLLYRLYEKDGVIQSELADEVLGDYPNITRLLDGLVKEGLVARFPDPNDRRKHIVKLTPKGKRTMKNLAPKISAGRELFFGDIPDRDMKVFKLTLLTIQDAVLQNLKNDFLDQKQ